MSFAKPTRKELSRHEAGHAYSYAAVCRYETPDELGLGRDEAGNVYGWCSRTTLLRPEAKKLDAYDAEMQELLRWQATAEAVIALAGPLAEFRHRERSRDVAAMLLFTNAERILAGEVLRDDSDFRRIRHSFDYIAPADPLAAFRRLLDVTDEIVHANWTGIGRLGADLEKAAILDDDALDEHFTKRPAVLCRLEGRFLG